MGNDARSQSGRRTSADSVSGQKCHARGCGLHKTTAKALLTKGKAPLKGCISAKTGKKYDSILTCDFSGDRLAYHIEFDKSSMSFGSKVGKCPFCGKPVAETAKAFTCTNKSCGAALWKESKLYGNELDVDADIAKTLLSGKTIEATIQNKERTGTQDVFASSTTPPKPVRRL